MKRLILITFSLFLLPITAQEVKKETPAERLLEVIEFKKNITKGGEASFFLVAKSLKSQKLNAAEMAEMKSAFMDYMEKLANDPELRKKVVKLYNANFNESEINKLIEFYRTPLGKKVLSSQPVIMGKIMQLTTVLAKKHIGGFQEKLKEILMRKARENQAREE